MSDDLRSRLNILLRRVEAVLGHESALREVIASDELVEQLAGIVGRNDSAAEFKELHRLGRLDLTLEALILDPKVANDFDASVAEQARGRLDYYGHDLVSQAEGLRPGVVVQAVRRDRKSTRTYRVEFTRAETVFGREFWFEDTVESVCRYSKEPVELMAIRQVQPGTPPIEGTPRGDQPEGSYGSIGLRGAETRFDWTRLHAVMDALPSGQWTTYGDLAELVGTAPQPLGQHIYHCGECRNAHRVLTSTGRIAEGFRWSDPDDARLPEELLVEEGVPVSGGAADPGHRLSVIDLRNLLAGS